MNAAIKPEDLLVDDDERVSTENFRGFYLGKNVPFSLLKRAMGLPGKSLAIYVGLWVHFSIHHKREIRLERQFFAGAGIAPTAITRGIDQLVRKGLIEEKSRKPGTTPVVYLRTEVQVEEQEEAHVKS